MGLQVEQGDLVDISVSSSRDNMLCLAIARRASSKPFQDQNQTGGLLP